MIGVILIVEKGETKDYYFIKISGRDHLVLDQSDAVRTAIVADAKLEKLLKLENVID